MVTVDTYWATIFLGFKNTETGITDPLSLELARKFCSNYVNDIGLGVTLTPTEYIYTNGGDPRAGYTGEPGVMIGLINYPRFPSEPSEIRELALELARNLKAEFEQNRVTVMFPDETVMLGDE